jgi:succinate dehydrogenase / fumarate reductase cytochrome b subunit
VGSAGHRPGLIAVSGLTLVLFLVLHLAGVALAPLAPQRFIAWADALHQQAWLPAAELLLLAAGLAHPSLSLLRLLANRRARGPAPALQLSRRGDPLASLAARTAPLSGAVLLLFLAVHLAQLRLPRPAAGLELVRLQAALAAPPLLALYLAAALALGLHLLHGVEAAHRGLGLLDPGNGDRIRRWGRGLALLLAAGFGLVPLLLVWP